MSTNLAQIERRHGRDGWKDALFIGLAVLLTALSIGAVTSKATGKSIEAKWEVTVKEAVPTPQ
jgi:hypothetical protein